MKPTVMINPIIRDRSTETEADWEGCQSIPGIRVRISRYKWVDFQYQDLAGEYHEVVRYSGFKARILQHELDHLNGIMIVDVARSGSPMMAEQEFQKMRRRQKAKRQKRLRRQRC